MRYDCEPCGGLCISVDLARDSASTGFGEAPEAVEAVTIISLIADEDAKVSDLTEAECWFIAKLIGGMLLGGMIVC